MVGEFEGKPCLDAPFKYFDENAKPVIKPPKQTFNVFRN